MSDSPKRKRLIFEVDDFCEEPLTDEDLEKIKDDLNDAVSVDYDMEIISLKVENVNG